MTIHYTIQPLTNQHIYEVTLSFTATNSHQLLRLPVWIPGSYMVREFSKNIISLSTAEPIKCEQISKNEWQLNNLDIGKMVNVNYMVYAYEFGIRTAYLDHLRGYFNPTSLCLAVAGGEDTSHKVAFTNLPANWQVTSGLTQINSNLFEAANYDELVDAPFELGTFERLSFEINGVSHYLILSGKTPEFDRMRMLADIEKICRYQINLFDGVAPYTSYSFMLNLSGEIYTGLEHRNSTLLMAPWYSLPSLNKNNDENYLKLLGLISHEFFHTWNVKRIKPAVFTPYELFQENYTQLLWWFEGVTSYYDDLVLYRTGIYTREQYLQVIVDNINSVYKFASNETQTLVNSSLTSWIKYYRQDENSPNSIVSYYVKGSLTALLLDLYIRKNSNFSLDDVMRYLFSQWKNNPVGVGENEIPALVLAATGVDVTELIHIATETTNKLPLAGVLADFGLQLNKRQAKNHQDGGKYHTMPPEIPKPITSLDLGAKLEKSTLGYTVKNVYSGTPAALSGLAGGDNIIALNGIKLTNLEQQLAFCAANQAIKLSLFRQEKLLDIAITPDNCMATIAEIQLENLEKLSAWL